MDHYLKSFLKNPARSLRYLIIALCAFSTVHAHAQCGLTFTTSATLTVACTGNCTGQATINGAVTGGSGNYSYLWSPGGETTVFAQNLCAGTVTLTVTDVTNVCDTVVTFIVTEPSPVTANIFSVPACNGQCDGSVLLVASGGGGGPGSPYQYQWIDLPDGFNPTPDTTFGSIDSLLTIPGLCPGDYDVILRDQLNCSGSGSGTVTEATPLVATIATSTDASCFGICDGTANASVSGSIPQYTYSWDDPAAQSTANATQLCGAASPGTQYTVTVTDSIGCTATAGVNITEPPEIITAPAQTDPACGSTCNGTASPNASGGTPGLTYTWSDGQSSGTAIGLCQGTYTVTVTDNNNCTKTESFILSQPTGLQSSSTSDVTCAGGGNISAWAMITPTSGTAPYTYLWNDAAAQTTQTAVGLTMGESYTVNIQDATGCQADEIITVVTKPCPLVIPNTFSPNGDDFNDAWYIENLVLYTQAKVKVYNRWGDIVFSSAGYDTPWEGKVLGAPLPAAVYYYVIEVEEIGENYAGSVTIVR